LFVVGAAGQGPIEYQWQKNSADLTDGGHYSGVTTPTLVISNADANDAASYRCVVTNLAGSTTSHQAPLAIDGVYTIVGMGVGASVGVGVGVSVSVGAGSGVGVGVTVSGGAGGSNTGVASP
jgi:hypothetical protein